MARSTNPPAKNAAEKKTGRIKQIVSTYRLAKQGDPQLGLILLGVFVVVGVLGFVLAVLTLKGVVFPIVFGVLVGSLATLIVFGRRAQRSALAQIEGKPGAAASALGLLRRGWTTEPMIGFTKQQDVVTRLVGPPGIVLIGEGNPNRLKPLIA
ncbi:MAG TPA: DUF4191 family protein, partial [Marmoricola sp.]